MNKILACICFFLIGIPALAQMRTPDHLVKAFEKASGVDRGKTAIRISQYYWETGMPNDEKNFGSALFWARTALNLPSDQLNDTTRGNALYQIGTIQFNSYMYGGNFVSALDTLKLALDYLHRTSPRTYYQCLGLAGNIYHLLGYIPKAIIFLDNSTKGAEKLGDTATAAYSLATLGHCYFDISDYKLAYSIGMDAVNLSERVSDTLTKIYALLHLLNLYQASDLPQLGLQFMYRINALHPPAKERAGGIENVIMRWAHDLSCETYIKLGERDSARWIAQFVPYDTTDFYSMQMYGRFYAYENKDEQALVCFEKSYRQGVALGHTIGIGQRAVEIGRLYLKSNNLGAAEKFGKIGLEKAQSIHALVEEQSAAALLSEVSEKQGHYADALRFDKLYKLMNDSVAPEQFKRSMFLSQVQGELEKQKQSALILSQENKIREQQLRQSAIWRNVLIGGLIGLLFLAGLFYRNNIQRRRSNELLQTEKEKVEQALKELKAMQSQLIQREKMASLGELTAGVAHEIQNPLNFVNNFSDLNKELVADLYKELDAGNYDVVREIAADIANNESKILAHGRRADGIVKGMLEHSRSNPGAKTLTDINELADEYLRLSYHGLRAKDKDFNGGFETHFDPQLPKMKIIPQDFGRVLLNIFNNAFYAVNERRNRGEQGYLPMVTVSTINTGKGVEIIIYDNGGGIAANIRDKIFQPFFTTKPTGQGTGLGLSLSYDIVTKGHGGNLTMESDPQQGTIFRIELPREV